MARVRVVRWAWAVLAGLCALATCQVQQQCPARAEIAPCSCQVKKNGLDILCEFTDQQHIDNAMSVLKGKSLVIFYLKLRHNNLKKLPGFVFFGLDIRHLTIHNSSLSVVEEASLSSIGKMLTQLDVSQNSLTLVPSAAYKNLHHLLILNMNHNNINNIPNRAFQGLDTLEILTLYENKIIAVEPDAFVGLEKRLKRLNLGGNELTSVPQKSLAILDTLKKLEMQENQISKIQEGDFEGMKNLDSLGLAHNKLREVPARAFSHLSQLNSLELDGNNIVQIDPSAFAGLEGNIKALPALGFENLNSLETLNLQNNKIMHIPEEVMEPVVDTLRVVDIMDNPLVCDCELQWYKNWLRNLRDKDDEMMQKKRTVCIMPQEHREYSLQNLPLEKMNCDVKAYDLRPSSSSAILFTTSPATLCLWFYTVKCAL